MSLQPEGLRKFGEERFHFGFGVGVAFLRCDSDAGVEDLFGFIGAGFLAVPVLAGSAAAGMSRFEGLFVSLLKTGGTT